MKVLVTVGSQIYPFDRLFKAIDTLAEKNLEHTFFVQQGESKYKFKNQSNIIAFNYTSSLEEYISRSDLIITHSGVGTILQSFEYNKKILVVPRFKIFNEHINDHQVEIARKFAAEGYVVNCEKIEDLELKIQELGNKEMKKYVSNTSKFNLELQKLLNLN